MESKANNVKDNTRGDHADVNKKAFTLQAKSYAASPVINNTDRLERLVRSVAPESTDRVMELACGPGYVSLALAPHCREVTGFDLTPDPLEIARKNAAARDVTNVRFLQASAYEVPMEDESVDKTVSRYAFHHFEFPLKALREMARCCVANGRVVVEDLYTSESPARSAYQDRCEILRDPSHRHAPPISEMLQLFALAGLEVEEVATGILPQDGEKWLKDGFADESQVKAAREMLERDATENLSLMGVFHDAQGKLNFLHRTAIFVGRKL